MCIFARPARHCHADVSPRRAARRAIHRRDTAAARDLAGLGVPGVQALVDAFHGRKRHAAALMLHEALERMCGDGTVSSLANLRIPEASFTDLLRDRHAIVRSVSVRIVGHSGNHRWVPLVVQALNDDADPFVRCRAADALGDLAAVEAMASLTGAVERRFDPARYHALRALGRLGPVACSHLVRLAVQHPEDVTRREAAETIARVGDAASWEALLESLAQATSCEVRKTLVEAFGRSRVARATAPVARLLAHDPSPIVREAAAEALVTLRDVRSIDALLDSALHDPFAVADAAEGAGGVPEPLLHRRYPVRDAAAEALVVLGGAETREAIAGARSGQ
jgi:hypothetical protein